MSILLVMIGLITDNQHDKKYDYIHNIDKKNLSNMDINVTLTLL